MRRILSIDWDYFYPSSWDFDWGNSENPSPLMSQAIWHSRVSDINLYSGESALDTFRASVPKNFWSILKNYPQMFVADSHLRLWEILRMGNAVVTNIDAHHDSGYYPKGAERDIVDCGNWGQMGKELFYITEFRQVYPEYRRKERPDSEPLVSPDSTEFVLPKPAEYDLVFVCRSGSWTPPWEDRLFLQFINKPGLNITALDDQVLGRRSPASMKEARALKRGMDRMIKQMMSGKATGIRSEDFEPEETTHGRPQEGRHHPVQG